MFSFLLLTIIGIIFSINLAKSNGGHEENTIKCIAEKSELYVSKTCGHCAAQKQILGDDLKYFRIIDCTTEYEKCAINRIRTVPSWIIKNELYSGKKSLSQLKELTGC